MEALRYLSIGISTPRFLPPLNPKKSYKLNAVNGGTSSIPNNFSASKWADRLLSDFQFLPTTTSSDPPDHLSSSSSASTTTLSPPIPSHFSPPERHVSMPIDFYRVLGAEMHFLGDGIRRAYEARVSKPPQYGYSQDVLISRRQILQAACETLANPSSRREYNQGLAEDEFDTILTEVPWDKVPGALCVLQEAGETDVVLQIGENLLSERLPKSFKQDVVLAMALSYVDISRDAMALSPPDFIKGCEVLERALKLLQEEGASSLAPDLEAQIDETLEELTPRCVMELLALPLATEYHSKRREGLQGVRNILWAVGGGGAVAIAGGYTRENFMNEAFLRMTAAEQVDLFAATPSNIPAESFEVYGVALALVAQAFIDKKPHLIRDADNLFQQLQQSKVAAVRNSVNVYSARENPEMDFALERALCSLLIGELDDCRSWLGLDSEDSPYRDPSIINFVLEHSKDDKDSDYLPGLCKLLEIWLTEVVFPRFRDTEGLTFKLGDYYDDPTVLRYLERLEGISGSPLAAAAAIVKIGAEATAVLDGVKVSAIQALRKVFPLGQGDRDVKHGEASEMNSSDSDLESDIELEEDGSTTILNSSEENYADEIQEQEMIVHKIKDATVKIMCAGVVVGLTTLVGLKYLPARKGTLLPKAVASQISSEEVLIDPPPVVLEIPNYEEMPRMDAKLAESLVRKWQMIKSHALGRDHCLERLSEILDGNMLDIWKRRAEEIAEKGWHWEYSLLNLNLDSVTLSSDGRRATVVATLKESARLTDLAHPENNGSYDKTYSTRYVMLYSPNSGWKISEGAVLE